MIRQDNLFSIDSPMFIYVRYERGTVVGVASRELCRMNFILRLNNRKNEYIYYRGSGWWQEIINKLYSRVMVNHANYLSTRIYSDSGLVITLNFAISCDKLHDNSLSTTNFLQLCSIYTSTINYSSTFFYFFPIIFLKKLTKYKTTCTL